MIPRTDSAEPRHRDDDHDERGFLLVGVAMFVLALTILGVSLFSLSGFEAQFLGQSMRRSQAFYDALGGIDRSLRVLSETNNMNAVASNLPPGVVYARAWQQLPGGDDSLNVDWADTSWIRVRVVAERGSGSEVERRMIEARFRHTGSGASHLYEDVLATTGRIWLQQYPQHTGHGYLYPEEWDNVFVHGRIRQNSPVTSGWIDSILPYPPSFGGGGVADPKVAEFIAYWQPQAQPLLDYDTRDDYYNFDDFSGPVGVFIGPSFQVGADRKLGFGLSDGSNDDVAFNMGEGKPVIWLLPNGVHFEHYIRVRNTNANDRLIIVAGTSNDTTFKFKMGANLGIWFRGGIDCPIPLYLISNGTVSLDRNHDWNDTTDSPHLSIFAGGIHLRGPRTQSPYSIPADQLRHNLPGDAICQQLRDNHYLPNTLPGSGGNVQFTLVSGTFQDPPNP